MPVVSTYDLPDAAGAYRVGLMAVEPDRPTSGIVRVLLHPEDPVTLRVENALVGQLGDGSAGGEVGIQRQPGVRPLRSLGQLLLDERPDSRIARLDERRGEGPVVAYELLSYLEDVHPLSRQGPCTPTTL